jgi:hypothetical protein
MHLVGYLYEDYHDARSLEHKISGISCRGNQNTFYVQELPSESHVVYEIMCKKHGTAG